ncbi:sodium- and chloride-dependent glycine transporter 1-like [Mya arenaria]|nr:sodium- and chloride-dependent glycine transporter 1-like [Mya arenaria]XP_052805875.1 sodium- and chloride-dependent glycine transporter 1-like [Mya arenaria]XP_052805876.1 sodium- and chloride-dependent glycine transporter 1-like [Mya arenaria]XP_052805877.1 sodium- and chloride-dependent glycine transporter 1-like [Mya arenaria]XP_052805878.1 sodium- and chloride-dependent glycine transporter 1-like [Mya arenaria]
MTSLNEKPEYQYHLKGADENGDDSSSGSGEDENQERGNWSRKMDFILSCLSYAVGLGNVWRFPYVCYRNGAGAFLIPFIIMLFVTGIPLVYLELSFGQFASSGVVSIWKASPLFQGVGWAMFIVSVLIAIYYNMIIAYTIYYLFASFKAMLPWAECGSWSSEECMREDMEQKVNCSSMNDSAWCNNECFLKAEVNLTVWTKVANCSSAVVSPSDDYFHKVVLDISEGVHDMGGLKWQLALCLLAAWVLVCFCLAKGIKSGGKAAYFTAFFPYVVLMILLVRSLTLEGSTDGIIYYFKPQWSKLGEAKVWGDAAIQIFFSLSPCWGGLITLASYNKFHNNCFQDAIIVSIMDCVTSVFAGLVIFSIIGYMAHELNEPVSEVAAEGAGLAFIVYPEVVTKLPISQLWSVLFFLMLITLGLGTQISTVTTVHTTLLDQFPHVFRKSQFRRVMLLVGISTFGFIVGLAFATQGGMYILQLFDNYAATYSLLVIGLVESLALSWVYGADRFLTDIESMLGYRPSRIWAWSWKIIAPAALLFILIFTWVDFKPTKYRDEVFPGWADGLGWLISLSSILAIPIVMIYKIIMHMREHGTSFIESIKELSKVDPEWGPAKKENAAERRALDAGPAESLESSVPLTTFGMSGGERV